MKRKDIVDEQFARQAFKLASKASPDTLSKIAKYGKAGLTGLGKAVDIVNPFKSPVKKALGATGLATGYEYLKDPNAPIGTLVARGAKDVGDVAGKVLGWAAEKGAKFAGDFAKGLTEPDTDTKVAGKDKKEPEAARPSEPDVKPLPTQGIGFTELREKSLSKVLKKYELFLNEDIDDAFMDAIKGAESGGRNIKNIAGSNAYGHYQFLPSTAKNMAKDPRNRNTPIYGKSWEEFKQDPKLQREFMKVATQDYKNTLAANKIPVTGGTMYMAHHFGPSKAVKMYQAGPNAKMSDFYPEYVKNRRGETVPNPVYTQNPALKPNQTVQYTHDRLDNLMAKKDKSKTLATINKTPLWSGSATVAQNVPSTTSIKPTVPTATDQLASASTEPTRAPLIPPTQVAAIDSPKSIPTGTTPGFDYEALRQAVKRGENVDVTDRFLVPAGKTAALSEAYQHFKLQEQTPSRGTVGAELARTSGGQFATRADRLDQAKVDAALGPGFRAGSREANLALAQKFRTQQPQPDQSGQGAKPSGISAIANPAPIPSKFSSAADAAGLATLGTAGVSLAKGAATPVLAKVGGAATRALPVVGGAFMAADAARRYDLGDTTGAAISAAGVHPVLSLPAVGIQAVRDKYRTGSFFPDDEELKAAAAPKLKEGNKQMNKQQLKKRLGKLEEAKAQLQEALGSFARAGAKYGGALKSKDFGKMLTGLGTDLKPPADVTRKAGQTFDRVRGTGSSGDAMVQNRRTGEVLPLSDIGKTGSKPPAVWRKGGDAGVTTTATKTAPKAAGAADDVAAAAAKGGKPLSRTATALGSAVGGGLIGYGLGKMGGDDKPQPGPDPTPIPPGPDPAPRPTPPKPPKPTPDRDDPWDLRPVKPSVDDTPGSEDWLRRRVNQPTTTDNIKPTDDAKDLSDRYGPDSYVATDRSKPADDNIDVKATADRDRISRMVNQTNESLDEILRLAGMSKK